MRQQRAGAHPINRALTIASARRERLTRTLVFSLPSGAKQMTEQPKTGSIAIEEHLAIVAFYKKVIVHLNRKIHGRQNGVKTPDTQNPMATPDPINKSAGGNIIVIDFRARRK
jgi:hypothetical protein